MTDLFCSLSVIQKEIVFNIKGKSVIRACPGSGKTYSLSAKLAYLIKTWDEKNNGIAAISFTNTAWKEIDNNLKSKFEIQTPISYPHFLGTIDSFVNQYIFLPFGHLIMECENRPILVGEPHGNWTGGKHQFDCDRYFDKASYNIENELVPTVGFNTFHFRWSNTDGSLNKNVEYIEKSKLKYWKVGYATQNDANYIAFKILEKYPELARSIVKRFPQFIIDEAQDTSEIHMGIINILLANGLNDILLVGDPDQAIFEWNEANPNLFIEKFEEWNDNSLVLNENRRSSERICNFTQRLSTLSNPSLSVNEEVKNYTYQPNIQNHNEEINQQISIFLEECKDNDVVINKENVAVIYRSKDFYYQIMESALVEERGLPWRTDNPLTRELVKGKFIYDFIDTRKGYKLIEKVAYKFKYKTNYCSEKNLKDEIEKVGFVKFRKRIFNFIKLLPCTQCTIYNWIREANQNFEKRKVPFRLSIDSEKGDHLIENLFYQHKKNDSLNFRVGTIHSVKGESFEAVLVLLKQKGGKGKFYKTLIKDNVSAEDNEELRIVYVGITRPSKLLVLAVPTEMDKESWEEKLLNT